MQSKLCSLFGVCKVSNYYSIVFLVLNVLLMLVHSSELKVTTALAGTEGSHHWYFVRVSRWSFDLMKKQKEKTIVPFNALRAIPVSFFRKYFVHFQFCSTLCTL